MKRDFDIYYNDDVLEDCRLEVSNSKKTRVSISPDYARGRIAFLDKEIINTDKEIKRVEQDIKNHKEKSVKRGIVGVLDEEIKETRNKKRELGTIDERDYRNAKGVIRGGICGSVLASALGFMMSGLGSVPFYMVIGLVGGGVLNLFTDDSNAIFRGLKKIYLNYKEYVYRKIKGICAKKKEKRYYSLPSYYKLEDELEELKDDKSLLVSERDMLKREHDLYYRNKSNGCNNAYHFDNNSRFNGYEMSNSNIHNSNNNGKVRRR